MNATSNIIQLLMLLAPFYTFDITYICNIAFTKILAISRGKIAKSSQWTMFTIVRIG